MQLAFIFTCSSDYDFQVPHSREIVLDTSLKPPMIFLTHFPFQDQLRPPSRPLQNAAPSYRYPTPLSSLLGIRSGHYSDTYHM